MFDLKINQRIKRRDQYQENSTPQVEIPNFISNVHQWFNFSNKFHQQKPITDGKSKDANLKIRSDRRTGKTHSASISVDRKLRRSFENFRTTIVQNLNIPTAQLNKSPLKRS